MTIRDKMVEILRQLSLPDDVVANLIKHLPENFDSFEEAREVIEHQLQKLNVPNPEVITKRFNDFADKIQNS